MQDKNNQEKKEKKYIVGYDPFPEEQKSEVGYQKEHDEKTKEVKKTFSLKDIEEGLYQLFFGKKKEKK